MEIIWKGKIFRNYVSVWVNDKANGPARMIYSNGDV